MFFPKLKRNLAKIVNLSFSAYDYIKFRFHNMNMCNKTLAFPILKQYYTKFPSIFIIYSNEKSLSVIKIRQPRPDVGLHS